MKSFMKRTVAFFAIIILVVTAIPFSGYADYIPPSKVVASSGICGENLTYTYDSTTKELIISGTGAMDDYFYDFISNTSPFYGSDIVSVIIENGVTSIGDYAFCRCKKLTSIIIPDSVISIGDFTFSECYRLSDMTIPDSVTSIGDSAFSECNSLISITIPNSVTSIGGYAFSECNSLTSITIPDSTTSIGGHILYNSAYYNDESNWENAALYIGKQLVDTKTSISGDYTIKDGTLTIAGEAFSYCESMTNITIPNSVLSIGDGAFSLCYDLENITIPNSVLSIGDMVFYSCDNFTSIIIPESVTSIGENIFGSCGRLTSILVDENNQYYSSDGFGVLYNKNKTNIVKYPEAKKDASYIVLDGVNSIADYTFKGNHWLKSIIIPDSVVSIGDYAFEDCENIKSIIIPDGVTSIGDYAFCDCRSLESVIIPDSIISIGNNVFMGFNSLKNIYYDGTEEQWNSIKMGFQIEGSLSDVTIHYNFDKIHIHEHISTIIKESTCVETGIKTLDCFCGDSYTETIPATGHNYKSEIKKATLKADGIMTETCEICGHIILSDIYKPSEFILSKTAYTYNGKEKTPSLTIKTIKGDKLVKGKDYTLTMESGRINAGVYTYTVTFIGNYSGTKKVSFKILPGKTSSLTATQSTDSIKLTWNKVEGATGYIVYQYNSSTGNYKKIKTISSDTTTYTVKNLKAGTTYKFAVKAFAKCDDVTLQAETYKEISTCTKPATPTVKITAGSKKATLSWGKITGATGYEIFMKNDAGKYEKIGTTTKTTYTKKSLKSGQKYYFRVRAYKTLGGKNIYSDYKTYSVKVK